MVILKLFNVGIIIVFTSFLFNEVNLQGNKIEEKTKCTTLKSEPGECRKIENCPKLLALTKEAKNDKDTKDYLIGSVCDYVDKNPVICCPTDEMVDFNNETYDTLLSPPACGVSKEIDGSRIVGGKVSRLGDWPWEVAVGYEQKAGRKKDITYHCGGALVSDQYVLTAAHCKGTKTLIPVLVRMGVVNIHAEKSSNPSPLDIHISKFITHEKYNDKKKYLNDIALIKLAHKVHFTESIQPICLPKTPDFRIKSSIGDIAHVSGWGTMGYRKKMSKELLEIDVPILSNSLCQDAYTRFDIRLSNKHLCAGYMDGKKDACQGDSGGPLMLESNGSVYSLGIVSFGYRCAESGYPGIYTKVAAYLDWIVEHLK